MAEMSQEQHDPAGSTGVFLYGVVPSDVEPEAGAEGIGSPPGHLKTVRQDGIAALISEVRIDQPLGRPADLNTYEHILNDVALVTPVLPVRFGTVMTTADAVEDWLRARHDELESALTEFDGRIQYTVHGRFREPEFLSRLLAENAAAAELADQIRGASEMESRQQRIQLGEMIARAVEQRQQAENHDLVEAVGQYAVDSTVLPPSHEMDAVHVAWLVEMDQEEEFVQAVEEFAEQRQDLIRMRLLGPLAPYDFVAARPGG
jgi:hypothetical protein